ncbi:MAG: tRNA uracil 4-sulfurtransferase ThiI [Candidatus Merdivicinus sp.]|jgi:thiamine biosynthesis protein ThiI
MKELILIKNGEIALKGLNKSSFEDILMKNIRWRLRSIGEFRLRKAQSTIYLEPADCSSFDFDEAIDRLTKIFGIASLSRALVVEKSLEALCSNVCGYLEEILSDARTFKVETRRSDKQFPLKSPEISAEVGGVILSHFPHIRVDVHNPEVVVNVEIRDFGAYIHAGSIPGAGGMPVSSSGKAMILISGGLDSPVAAYMMAKRGLALEAIHFVSPPYTSDRALQKVETLCEKLVPYTGSIKFHCVPFTEIQEAIKLHCPEELFTVIMRRLMMKIATAIAKKEEIRALVTGESLAQVASQTLDALYCTDNSTDLVVLRPLIGMDKTEIIKIAYQIDTYETSILPYEDCCTVFTPRHPRTRPKLYFVEKAESGFDFGPLLERAIQDTVSKTISF